jgi:putative heme-binding domain-containing protein
VFRGDALGPDTAGQVFVCEPVSHLVTRRRLQANGAGFTSTAVDPEGTEFLASRDRWFRPVFTATGPDGALWVVDMCRGSVEHPDYMPPGMAETVDHRAGEAAGRIWRIRTRGDSARPWTPPQSAAEAAACLADPNGWRRSTCQRLLVEGRFPDAAEALEQMLDRNPGAIPTVHGLWALDGLGQLAAHRLQAAARSPHPAVRETAARLVARAAQEKPGDAAAERLAEEVGGLLVADPDSQVRLAATLAVAGCRGPAASEALGVAATGQGLDAWIARAVLSGAVGRSAGILTGLASAASVTNATPGDERAEALPSDSVVDLVFRLGVTATGSESQRLDGGHGEDAAAAVALLVERVRQRRTNWFDITLLAGLADRCDLKTLAAGPEPQAACRATLTAAGRIAADPSKAPACRRMAILLLGSARRQGDATLAAEARSALETLVTGGGGAEIQAEAIAALARGADAREARAIVEGLSGLEPAVRAAAVAVLLDRHETAAPLLEAIEAGSLPPAVVPLERRGALEAATDSIVQAAAKRIWGSGAAAGLSAAEVDSLLAEVRRGGVPAHGRDLFLKHCGNCHQVAGAGHQVGPDLAEAVERPVERLVVDIVDPNRSVEPRWESTLVITEDGQVIEGILVESNADSVVLLRSGGTRQTVPREAIEVLKSQARSLMPEGFGRQLTAAQFADLIAFLRTRDR